MNFIRRRNVFESNFYNCFDEKKTEKKINLYGMPELNSRVSISYTRSLLRFIKSILFSWTAKGLI